LYLTDADYQSVAARFSPENMPFVAFEVQATADSPRRWRLSDIIGSEDGLGVECLSGSAASASSFAQAFDKVFTVTLVSGRTVGIGAYLARLGRRYVTLQFLALLVIGLMAR
jgi:acetyl-CoA carboxylase/biotin carboxylase 1